MSLTLYSPALIVKAAELERTFPQGGIVLKKDHLNNEDSENDHYEIFAYVYADDQLPDFANTFCALMNEARESCPDYAVEMLIPKKKEWEILRNVKLYKSDEDFFMGSTVDMLCQEVGRWAEDPENILIVYGSERRYNPKMGMIAVYGATILSEEEFLEKNAFPFKPRFMTYKEFKEKFRYIIEERERNKSAASKLQIKIREFVEMPGAYKLLLDKLNERVLGQEQLHVVAQNVFYWLRGIAKGVSTKNNTILVAPSGCGKTELFRTLKAVLDELIGGIPVSCKDLSLLTTEGFKGADSKFLISDLFQADTNGIGIVMLDEADKKMLPCFSNSGDNVNQEVQSQILTMIEGAVFYEKENSSSGKVVDTNNTLFIAAGAFQYIRDKRGQKKSLGFGSQQEEEIKRRITREDMIAAGAMPEFVGRFNSVINFEKLNKASVTAIAERFAKELSQVIDCEVIISEKGADELYERFLQTEMGCRMLKCWIYEPVYEVGNQILLEDSCEEGVKVIYHGEHDVEVEGGESR